MAARNMLRTYEVKKGLFQRKIGYDDSVDVTKFLQQFEMHE